MFVAATGMRPVNDPFESLDMLDLPRSLALVADKSSHQPNEARLVPLTAMTVALVTHWRDHLQRLARAHGFTPLSMTRGPVWRRRRQ